MAESLQASHEVPREAYWIETVKVASSQILVGPTILQHVIDNFRIE